MEGIEKQAEQKVTETTFSGRKYGLAGAFLGVLFLFLIGAVYTVNKISKPAPVVSPSPKALSPLADATIVYGYWTDNSSIVKALDLSTGKEAELMAVGKNVKHVKVISGKNLIYLKDTDIHDYGKELVIHNVENNEETTVIHADDGFGIDDYKVSPDGNFAAVWMAGTSSEKVQFSGSASRVYSVNTENGEKHLLYDEISSANVPVNYPLAVSDDGTVYTDKFLPNSGAGWGYGMSVSDFKGLNKKEILEMKNGTYSTQPVMSRNGKYLAFAGYSGNDGMEEKEGYRKALTIPDTLEFLELPSLNRKKIDTNLNNAIYSEISWNNVSDDLQFEVYQNKSKNLKTSFYSYSPSSKSLTILNDSPKLDFITVLSQGVYLMAQKFQNMSGIGNLGSGYDLSINKLYVVKDSEFAQNPIPISESPIQLIEIEPKSYFPVVDQKGVSLNSLSDKQLKLQTFAIKPTLAPQRLLQQSNPPPAETTPNSPPELPECKTITYPQCNQLLGTNYSQSKDLSEIDDPAFADCMWQKQAEASASCLDSPLYLYGPTGTQVKVRVGTQANNFNVNTKNNILDATLGLNGTINVDGKSVPSISYDYFSKITKLSVPTKGWIVSDDKKTEKIKIIGQKLGLNKNEISDLVSFISTVNAPYLFVSFYDQDASQAILPLYFDPEPEAYKNIVFYIKKMEEVSADLPAEPEVVTFTRKGFTAVEISYIVE